jgi:L-ascorbate metabolism protein UlaG (beta-lactamase superfamily)
MELTKHGHACVSLTKDGRRIVLDPGGLTGDDATDGAEAVLVTHEHFDHFSEERLRSALDKNPGLDIWAIKAVADKLDGFGGSLHAVGDGDRFEVAGFEIEAYGQWHAEIHPDIPRITNVGFFVDGTVFHPGDALTVPGRPVDTLMLPVHAPWSRTAELIDWVREVAPGQTLAVHDGALNDFGLMLVGGLLGEDGPGINSTYSRLGGGESVQIG